MQVKIWAVFGAVVCGLLLARLLGVTTSTAVYLSMIATFLILAAITYAIDQRAKRRHARTRRTAPKHATGKSHRVGRSDRALIQRLEDLLPERKMIWLRAATFEEPWLDASVDALRELVVSFGGGRTRIFDPSLETIVANLVDSVRLFLRIYDGGTSIDPIMKGETWRVVGELRLEGAPGEAVNVRAGVQRQLVDAATDICDSYDALRKASRVAKQDRGQKREPASD